MAQWTETLCKLTPSDARQAAAVLADAFKHDPVWLKVFEGSTRFDERYRAFFEVPVRCCMRYGDVFTTSPNMEGIAGWLPERYADITPWRILLSGAIGCGLKMGKSAARRMRPLTVTLSPDRKVNMRGRKYQYLLVIGVAERHQGKGFGGRLLRGLIERCDREGRWLYLETETEENIRFYEKRGFKVLKRILLPELELPMWEMAREPTHP